MVDSFTKSQRSALMSRIGQRNTRPEMIVRSFLHMRGFRFRIHKKKMPGTPDIWLRKYNTAIFVHGCFWHRHRGCKYASTPVQNERAWKAKFTSNVVRDKENIESLAREGKRVLIVWDCALKTNAQREKWLPKIERWLLSTERYGEIPRPQWGDD